MKTIRTTALAATLLALAACASYQPATEGEGGPIATKEFDKGLDIIEWMIDAAGMLVH